MNKSQSLGLLRRLLPWLGSIGIVWWLVVSQDLEAAAAAAERARLGLFFLLWLLAIGVTYALDAYGLKYAVSMLCSYVRYAVVLRVKGISYFLNIVNYAAASGGIAWSLARRTGVSLSRVASTILFLNVVDLLVLNVLVSVGLALEFVMSEGAAFLSVDRLHAMLVVNLAIYALYFGSMTYWNLGWNYGLLGRLRDKVIFDAFARARVSIHWKLFLVRLALLLVYIVMQYTALRIFDVHAPFHVVLVVNTVVTLAQTVPVSVAGIGTVQVVMLEMYSPYGTPADILAYSTATLFVFILIRAAIGFLCLSLDRSGAHADVA